jgi:hypothetical protein
MNFKKAIIVFASLTLVSSSFFVSVKPVLAATQNTYYSNVYHKSTPQYVNGYSGILSESLEDTFTDSYNNVTGLHSGSIRYLYRVNGIIVTNSRGAYCGEGYINETLTGYHIYDTHGNLIYEQYSSEGSWSNIPGGSGIVIISFPTDGSTGVSTASTGGTITTVGGNQIHTFTSSGTWTMVAATTTIPNKVYSYYQAIKRAAFY